MKVSEKRIANKYIRLHILNKGLLTSEMEELELKFTEKMIEYVESVLGQFAFC